MTDITKPNFLHILRNPYGFTEEQIKKSQLDACIAYELMEDACKLMESTTTDKQISKAKDDLIWVNKALDAANAVIKHFIKHTACSIDAGVEARKLLDLYQESLTGFDGRKEINRSNDDNSEEHF